MRIIISPSWFRGITRGICELTWLLKVFHGPQENRNLTKVSTNLKDLHGALPSTIHTLYLLHAPLCLSLQGCGPRLCGRWGKSRQCSLVKGSSSNMLHVSTSSSLKETNFLLGTTPLLWGQTIRDGNGRVSQGSRWGAWRQASWVVNCRDHGIDFGVFYLGQNSYCLLEPIQSSLLCWNQSMVSIFWDVLRQGPCKKQVTGRPCCLLSAFWPLWFF